MRLLIIGELNGQISEAAKIARDRGAKVGILPDVEAAMEALRAGQGADLLLVDVRQDIAGLVKHLEAERLHLPVVACGLQHDSKAAVAAIKAGAKEYIPLPPEAELIAAVLEAITQESNEVIYKSAEMGKALEMARQVAPSDASVLITGESGTGKEVIARFIHHNSKRKNQPFISVNCAAIPETLLESELFGYEKGAFTGAVSRRIGKFEEANSGTLLLDEISEMDIRLQSKLLRAIQEHEIDRIGGGKPIKVDIRILATSNRDLQAEVKAGRFREDLYFRLNVISLRMPALRERPDDIPLLAEHFIVKYAQANGVPVRPLSAESVARMRAHSWPGNVRELENTMHRAVLMAMGDTITPEALLLQDGKENTPEPAQAAATQNTPERSANELVGKKLSDVEKTLILDTLDYCLGNRTHAANILGISIRTLRNKLREYGDMGEFIPPSGNDASAKNAG